MKLGLNLRVYQSRVSPAWLEARHGRLWEQGIDGIQRYNELRKTEPMQRALQRTRRAHLVCRPAPRPVREPQAHPPARMARWPLESAPDLRLDRPQIFDYLRAHGLPYHPLWDEGYVSIGDWHTTRTLAEAGDAEATRFFGLKRECGMHGLDG